jgi:hypothetical protein
LVLCVDETTQIQGLDRTQPTLPLRPGKAARMTHDKSADDILAKAVSRQPTSVTEH